MYQLPELVKSLARYVPRHVPQKTTFELHSEAATLTWLGEQPCLPVLLGLLLQLTELTESTKPLEDCRQGPAHLCSMVRWLETCAPYSVLYASSVTIHHHTCDIYPTKSTSSLRC